MIARETKKAEYAFHTILIISADAEMASVWETLFKQKDCAVINETCQSEAVQTAKLISPSLIILDLDLPHSERLALCCELRATTQGTLLLLTPKENEQRPFEYYRAGVNERLFTPINPLVLLVKSLSWLTRCNGSVQIMPI